MSRKPRIQFAGATYFLTNTGNRDQAICADDQDFAQFRETLAEAATTRGWRVHALCVVPSQFQLVLETPDANLVHGMRWFLSTYTSRFNKRNNVRGHLFAGRYKSTLIDTRLHGALRSACDFVHLLPVRSRLITLHQKLREYKWSSFPWYLDARMGLLAWLRLDVLLREHGLAENSEAARNRFEFMMEDLRRDEGCAAWIEERWFLRDRNLDCDERESCPLLARSLN